MFHGGCREVSKVLSMGSEPISKSAVHYLAKRVSEVRVSKEPRYRRCMAVDETKLRVKKSYVYMVCCRRGFQEITGSGGIIW
jgi:transposase-like protein